MSPLSASLLSGFVWGAIGGAAFAGWGWEWPRLATSVAVGVGGGVGVLVYLGSRWVYRRRVLARVAWAVVTLYAAVAATGAAVGLAGTGALSLEALAVGLVACSVLTVFVPLWPLFGLAFLNHEWLRAVYLDSLDSALSTNAVH